MTDTYPGDKRHLGVHEPPENYRTKFHRNGHVTLWNVYTQKWECYPLSTLESMDKLVATLPAHERARILGRTV